jgi:hypothetical protein
MENRFEVELGVHGASKIHRRMFTDRAEALAAAERWSRSNSTGHYFAEVVDHGAGSRVIARYNLAPVSA